jgi:pimeloyl-ACP methyl ester carboxylesterase|nr:alpha/beta hydrolase [Kofleriaceae bacterium]
MVRGRVMFAARFAALAVALGALGACGATPKHVDDDDPPEITGDAFSDSGSYKPKSFTVEVHGEGRPVILIPGLGCPGSVWDETVAHLAGFQTHVLTLAGFAGQPRIHKPLSATVRRELVRYIRSRHLKSPVIIGHSLGGFIAYWLAASEPELVGAVIVVDAGPALTDTDPETAKQLRELWTQAEDDEYAQQVHDAFIGMGTDSKRMLDLIKDVERSDRQAMGDAIYELETTDLRQKVSAISAPVLLVLADGGLQQFYRQEVATIPHLEIDVIPRTHHFVMWDDPKGFFGVVDPFLAKNPATTDKD